MGAADGCNVARSSVPVREKGIHESEQDVVDMDDVAPYRNWQPASGYSKFPEMLTANNC